MASVRPAARAAVDVVVAGGRAIRQRGGDLVVAPAKSGSLGDDLLVRGALSLMPADTRVGGWSPSDRWPGATDQRATLALVASRRLGGSWMPAVSRAWSSAVFIGADVLDGTYNLKGLAALDLIDAVAARGRPAAVVGFSFSTRPRAEMVERIARTATSVRFVARGETSAARFRDVTGRECAVAPDLSWAYFAQEHAGPAEEAAVATPVQVGVNLGGQVADRYGTDRLLDVFESVSRRLLEHGVELVALPHDFRGPRSDRVLLDELSRRVEVRPWATRHPDPAVWREAGRCRAVLSCRMHLSIASLAQGVPVVAMGYQDKFEDLARSPDLRDRLTVVDGTHLDADEILEALQRAVALPPLAASDLAQSRDGRRDELRRAFAGVLGDRAEGIH